MAFKAAVLGLGNIGRFAVESLEIAPDFDCIGVVRRKESLGKAPHELRGVPEFSSMEELVRGPSEGESPASAPWPHT